MRFFADHCVMESVCRLLERRGHEVIRLKDKLPIDAPDPVVARLSEAQEAILLTLDKDFKKIAPRIPKNAKNRFKKLSRVQLECHPNMEKRVLATLDLIEFEWEQAQKRSDKRLHMVIRKGSITTHR